jgi:hypothetical protein
MPKSIHRSRRGKLYKSTYQKFSRASLKTMETIITDLPETIQALQTGLRFALDLFSLYDVEALLQTMEELKPVLDENIELLKGAQQILERDEKWRNRFEKLKHDIAQKINEPQNNPQPFKFGPQLFTFPQLK